MSQSVLQIPDFHPKQLVFYNSKATEILWGGDTRGGKTAGTKLSLIRWCSLIPGLQTDIFRLREQDVIGGYMEGEFGFPMLLRQWIKDGLVTHNQTEIRFWNGSLISLENCFTDNALSKVQGIPKHVRVIDEAGQIPEKRLKWLKLWMTMSEEVKEKIPEEWRDQFPKIIYLTNRIGVSKGFLKRVFVRSRPKYAIEKVGAFYQQYIPADVRDNPSENIQDTIDRITEGTDSATAKALLSEDGWDAQTGNYFENWNEERHVIKDFIIPDFWLRARFFDYGSYEPWACVWMAVSPGVTIHEGTIYEKYLPRGCKVFYREWYGCKAEHPTADPKDLLCTNLAPKDWSNADIANGIIERTEERFDTQPTFTDKFPFIKLGGRAISDDFKKAGIKLTQGELDRKNRGAMTISNLAGTKLVAGNDEHWPMMVVFESCKYIREYMPMVERHPTPGREWDYQENGEATHICFSGDTLVKTRAGHARMDALKAGDEVVAGDGEYRKISASGLTRENAEIIKLTFIDGSTVECTPNHKILTTKGWTRACDSVAMYGILGECESLSFQKQFKSLTDENIPFTQSNLILLAQEIDYTELFGSFTTGRLKRVSTFIILMVTNSIIKLKTLKSLVLKNTSTNILHLRDWKSVATIWKELEAWLQLGINPQKVSSGISSIMQNMELQKCTYSKTSTAFTATSLFNQLKSNLNIAHPDVYKGRKLKVLKIEKIPNKDVYCITEPITHAFQLASGLVVSNCDCVTMGNVSHDIVYDAPIYMDEKAINANMQHPKNNRKTVRDIIPDLDM